VIALSTLWILIAFSARVVRSMVFARQAQAQQPSGDFYVVLLPLPGGLWTLLGPPALLAAAWIAMRRSRPAS